MRLDWPSPPVAPVIIWGFANLRLSRVLDSHYPIPFPRPDPKLDYGPGALFHFDSILSVLRTRWLWQKCPGSIKSCWLSSLPYQAKFLTEDGSWSLPASLSPACSY